MTYLTAKLFADAYKQDIIDWYKHFGFLDITELYCANHDIKYEKLDNVEKIDRVVQRKITREICCIQERVRKDDYNTITIRDSELQKFIDAEQIYMLTLKVNDDGVTHYIFADITAILHTITDINKYKRQNHQRKNDSAFYAIDLSDIPDDMYFVVSGAYMQKQKRG